jgi:SAM-dependent methyltransferase
MAEHEALHELDPTGRFGDRADAYARYRPDYPESALDAVLAGLDEPARLVAADVGAGTGIAARALARRGVSVLAVEPNRAMREAAEPVPGVVFRAGTAEATGLHGGSVDLVVCAQAFHWFRPRPALQEFHRILLPGGRLALLSNERDRDDAPTHGYSAALRAVIGDHPAEQRSFDPDVIWQGGLFSPPDLVTYPHQQALDLPGLIGRAISASYAPREGPAFEKLTALLAELFEAYQDGTGRIRLRYVTHLYRSSALPA